MIATRKSAIEMSNSTDNNNWTKEVDVSLSWVFST